MLIVFDLDGLKHINDSYGHHSGDVYIKTFTEMLQKRLKFIDVSARLGGDEFACLVSEPDLALIEKEILLETYALKGTILKQKAKEEPSFIAKNTLLNGAKQMKELVKELKREMR